MGGPDEARRDGTARDWGAHLRRSQHGLYRMPRRPRRGPLPRTCLPDGAFQHDGKMTKREVRAITLPAWRHGAARFLWGRRRGLRLGLDRSIRAARDARAFAIEPDPARRAMAARNATRLGAPRLALLDGTAPQALSDLPGPDAAFIGGGLCRETVDACLAALRPFGRLVANAVTLEIQEPARRNACGTWRRACPHRGQPGRERGQISRLPVGHARHPMVLRPMPAGSMASASDRATRN